MAELAINIFKYPFGKHLVIRDRRNGNIYFDDIVTGENQLFNAPAETVDHLDFMAESSNGKT